jgi:hypothetical protein
MDGGKRECGVIWASASIIHNPRSTVVVFCLSIGTGTDSASARNNRFYALASGHSAQSWVISESDTYLKLF